MQCGQLRRPLDPAQQAGPSIELHFAVLPALARNEKPDPVVFVAGGPGQSAIALAGPISQMLARFGNRRDIVLVDQRGTGRSAPLRCDDHHPGAPLAETANVRAQAKRALECLARLQALPHGDLRQYTTAIASADLEAVRLALGARQLNLVGVSYGTRVALDYLRQFPQSVRRVVLDGVAPPDMVLPAAAALDAQAAFDAMLAACEADAGCAGHHPQLRALWQALLKTLPRPIEVTHPLTGRAENLQLTRDMLLGMVRTALYSPVLASGLPAALQAAEGGKFTPLVGLSSALQAARGDEAVAQGMHFSVICAEDMPRLAAPPLPTAPDFGAGLAPLYQQVCAAWPRAQIPAAFYQLPVAPVPVLLLSGGIDPATPSRHGARVADALGAKALHAVVPNAGHGLLSLPCLRDAVFRFVDADSDAAALQVDTDCAKAIPRPPAFQPPGGAQ